MSILSIRANQEIRWHFTRSALPTLSTGNASDEGSEASVARPDDALSPVFGAVPCSCAYAPEAVSSAGSADSQPQDSVSGSGAPGDGACSAADAPEASSAAPGAPRFSSVRWEDIEDIVTAGTGRAVGRCRSPLRATSWLWPAWW
ncbi:unnamed protein product [Phytophthora fragariaefolia]|uniref:Unnamed protein product n=1 Tax=Phytophthora fragariaefolia TaxID=1490495 RepID=A0A9W6WU87_9STRA|nr:unnamed protein product [Phytophthora fragariaefolia]